MGAAYQPELPLPALDIEKVVERGRKLIAENDLELAKRLLSSALLKHENDPRLIMGLGAIEGRLGNHGPAYALSKMAAKVATNEDQKYKCLRNALLNAMKRQAPISMSLLIRQMRKFKQSENDFLVAKAIVGSQGMLLRYKELDQNQSRLNSLAQTPDQIFQVQQFAIRTKEVLDIAQSLNPELLIQARLPSLIQTYAIENRWGASYRAACKFLEEHPYSIDVLLSKMFACAAMGRTNESKECVNDICTAVGGDELRLELFFSIAQLLEIRDYDADAILVLEEAVELSNGRPSNEILEKLTELYESNEENKDSQNSILKLAQEFYPNEIWYKYIVAKRKSEDGAPFEAIEILKDILDVQPENLEAINLLGCVYSDVQNYTNAEVCFQQAIAHDHLHYNSRYNLAWLCNKSGNHTKAKKIYTTLLFEQPFNSILWNNLAVALSSLGKPKQARICFEKAHFLDAENVEALFNLGNEYKREGHFHEARSLLKALVHKKYDEPVVHFHLGDIAYHEDNLEEARRCFEISLNEGVFDPEQYTRLSLVCELLGDWESARKYGENGLDQYPEHVTINFNAGVNAKHFGERQAARQHFENCIRLAPRHQAALNNLGSINFENGDIEKAAALFTQADQVDNIDVISIFNLGLCHFANHETTAAERCFTDALTRNPEYHHAHLFLSITSLLKGMPDRAAKWMEEIPPEFSFSAEWSVFNVMNKLVAGSYEAAIFDLIDIKPSDAFQSIALILRGYAYLRLNQAGRGSDDFQAAISTLPSLKYYETSISLLTSRDNSFEIVANSLRQAVSSRKEIPIDFLRLLKKSNLFADIDKLLSKEKK